MDRKILILFGLLSVVLAATVNLEATIRDFTPQTSSDFESAITGLIGGLVAGVLDTDGKPIPTGKTVPCCTNDIKKWYRTTPGVNIAIFASVPLITDAGGVFTFANSSFFPIDNLGFGSSDIHNFHFTTEISTTFTHSVIGNHIFNLTANDDAWVFIDDKLALDLGGIHAAASGSIILNNLNLVNGLSYSLKIFHAQRHTLGSIFNIRTTLTLSPISGNGGEFPLEDLCGVTYFSPCAQNKFCGEKVAPKFHFGPGFITSPLLQYNVIAFNDFTVASGDTEGRVAVGGNFVSTGGYSIGNQVITSGANKILDPASFSFICQGSLDWRNSGSVEPFGPNSSPGYHNPSDRETSCVKGPILAIPEGIETQESPLSLPDDFFYAEDYYLRVSTELSSMGSNAITSLGIGKAIKIICEFNDEFSYITSVPAAAITGGTSWVLQNCNPDAQYILNVFGNGPVTFHGDKFVHPAAANRVVKVIYNIFEGQTVNVNTEVYGHILAPSSTLHQHGGVILGRVMVLNYQTDGQASQINQPRCPTPPPAVNPPPAPVCPYFEDDFTCDLDLRLGDFVGSFKDYNVISFGDFVADTGDIEGRLIVNGAAHMGSGYSIGAALDTFSGHDRSLPVSAVINQNCTWGNGELFPFTENMYVGGSFNAPAFLLNRRVSFDLSKTLDDDFASAFDCYSGISEFYKGQSSNVAFRVQDQGLVLNCTGVSTNTYVVNVEATIISSISWYATEQCVFGNRWIFNVLGSDNVTFGGNHMPAISGGVTYNIIGTGRTINVNTQVNGNILAPGNILNQRGGVIVGKVIVANVEFALQINKPNCPDNIKPENIAIQILTPARQGDTEIEYDIGGDLVKEGDEVVFPDGKIYHVKKVNGRKCTFVEAISSPASAGLFTTVNVTDPVAIRGPNPLVAASANLVTSAFLVLMAVVVALM